MKKIMSLIILFVVTMTIVSCKTEPTYETVTITGNNINAYFMIICTYEIHQSGISVTISVEPNEIVHSWESVDMNTHFVVFWVTPGNPLSAGTKGCNFKYTFTPDDLESTQEFTADGTILEQYPDYYVRYITLGNYSGTVEAEPLYLK